MKSPKTSRWMTCVEPSPFRESGNWMFHTSQRSVDPWSRQSSLTTASCCFNSQAPPLVKTLLMAIAFARAVPSSLTLSGPTLTQLNAPYKTSNLLVGLHSLLLGDRVVSSGNPCLLVSVLLWWSGSPGKPQSLTSLPLQPCCSSFTFSQDTVDFPHWLFSLLGVHVRSYNVHVHIKP